MSDIQFGELKQAEPDPDIRPDRDAHFCVLPCCGAVMPESDDFVEDELMIFVDLDVMRDMEAHAASDMSVELGGVMLGRQSVDENGRPFVVITDSLRAEHYHATKGSFTFTHDTWSRITEKRARHRPDLDMVGWYHTHPGWTVFLSGMDLFICNNFFNKPLDVALVIDPVSDERGWFQWTTGKNKNKRPTKGFYLISNRYRQDELKYFSSLYSGGNPVNADPRYSGNTFSGASQPVVNIMENSRRPMIELAIVAMLTLQFLLLTLMAWRMLAPAKPVAVTEQPTAVASQVQEQILSSIVAGQTGDEKLVDKFTRLASENEELKANLDGQMARADKYASEQQAAIVQSNKLSDEVLKVRNTYSELAEKHRLLEELAKEKGIDPEQTGTDYLQYVWWMLAGLIGGGAGFFFGRKRGLHEADEYYVESRSDSAGSKVAKKSDDDQDEESGSNFDNLMQDEPATEPAGGMSRKKANNKDKGRDDKGDFKIR